MTGAELLSDIYFYYLTINAALLIVSLFMENRKQDYLLKSFLSKRAGNYTLSFTFQGKSESISGDPTHKRSRQYLI